MQISISSGNYNIVDSGQVFLFGESHDLKIEVDTNKDFAFSMVFDFWNDGTEEIKIENKVVGQEIVFDCYNFDDKNSRSKKLPYLKLNLNLFNFKRRKPRYSAPLLYPKVLSFLKIWLEQIFKILPFLLEEAFFLFNKCYIQPLLRSFLKVQFHFHLSSAFPWYISCR